MDQEAIIKPFEKKVRLRACGVLKENNAILLVKHVGIGQGGALWSPPGGGVEFGESSREAVKREFLEETGLAVEVSDFLLFHEHIDPELHALELFFRVKKIGGTLSLGTDPELHADQQMMTDLRFWSLEEIKSSPHQHFHARFSDFLS